MSKIGKDVLEISQRRLVREKRYIFRKRFPTKTIRLKTPYGDVVFIDYPIVKGIKNVWQKGWKTAESCSSHIGEHIAPYVDFSSIPLFREPEVYKPLEIWFENRKLKLNLNYSWKIKDGSIFLVDNHKKRIASFVEPVNVLLHKELVEDLNKILKNIPKKE